MLNQERADNRPALCNALRRRRETDPSSGGPQGGLSDGESPRPRVCVLDPDPEYLQSVKSIFETMDIEVLAIDKVIGASNLIRRFKPVLLVADLDMPTISGEKLVKVLRKNIPQFPVLIIHSQRDRESLGELAARVTADDFAIKNGSLLELINRVKLHLDLIESN